MEARHRRSGGSDQQFQLVTAYLGYGEEGDAEFAEHAQGLFDGSLIVAGLEIDNNFTWTIINALSSVKLIDQAGIDAQLAKRDTTENRESRSAPTRCVATPPRRNGPGTRRSTTPT